MRPGERHPDDWPVYPAFTREWWNQNAVAIDTLAIAYGTGIRAKALRKLAGGVRQLADKARPAGVS